MADTDCLSTHYCDTGVCTTRKKAGTSCKAANECASTFCETGVCCDKACGGACESCALSGSAGVCSAIPGCETGSDAGAETSTDAGTDSGADTTAGETGASDTGLGVADAAAPKLPAIPKVEGEFQRCARDSECTTGFCVDGVCCDSRCASRCHSCALLTSPGKCTLAPVGVDLRNECGPSNQCLGTCGAAGECIGSGAGTMCGRNRCTGPSTGAGPVYCAGPGATCPTNESVAFDCGPFACDPAFGACRTVCVTSNDCANGFACETASKLCVPPAAPADEGGCVMGTNPASTSPFGAFALLVITGLARRGRRR